MIIKFLWKSLIAFIFIRILIKWNNIYFVYNVIIAIIINHIFNHDNIKIEKLYIIKNLNINNNV